MRIPWLFEECDQSNAVVQVTIRTSNKLEQTTPSTKDTVLEKLDPEGDLFQKFYEFQTVQIKENLKVLLHNQLDQINDDTDILLVNTYGETLKFYQTAKCVFLGKSLIEQFSRLLNTITSKY